MLFLHAFWNNLTFAARLFLSASFALFVSATVMLFVSAKQEADEIKADIQELVTKELDTLPVALSETVVLGDFATLQQTLDRYVERPLIQTLVFQDVSGASVVSQDSAQTFHAPNWYIRFFEFQDIVKERTIVVGQRNYGVLRLTASPLRLAARAWDRLVNHLLILSLAVLIDFIGIWLVLRFGLLPLKQLQRSIDVLAKGAVDVQFVAQGSPEIKQLGLAFQRMGKSIINTQKALTQEAIFTNGVLDTAQSLIIVIDTAGRVVRINTAAENFTGYRFDEMKDIPFFWIRFLLPEQRSDVEAIFAASIAGNLVARYEKYWVRRDGSSVLFDWSNALLHDVDGRVTHVVAVGIDISQRQAYELQLQLVASVFSHAREGILITDVRGAILDVNATFTQITGYSKEEALGNTPRLLKSGLHDKFFYQEMWSQMLNDGYWSGEICNRRKTGEIYTELLTIGAVRDEQDSIKHFVALFTDISALKAHQHELEHLAHFDVLTGLPNRVLFADRLSQGIAWSNRNKRQLAVVFIDLDGFKAVNDHHGHKVGDELLIIVSARMKKVIRDSDTLARIGGDEFVIVLVDISPKQELDLLLGRLLTAVSDPIFVKELELKVSASIGVTLYPNDASDADILMRHADQAMYRAKLSGKNQFRYFDAAQDTAITTQIESIEEMRQGLLKGDFVLYYQPKVKMTTGEIVGVEALIRWQHPDRGFLLPMIFLPTIETHPFILELSEWVIHETLKQIRAWQQLGVHLTVSVNIAALHLKELNFVERLSMILSHYPEVDPNALELEILETSSLEDVMGVSEIIHSCHAMGLGFALDDFGTGYSSLTYLQRLPVDTLKIDQSFIHDFLNNQQDQLILEAIIQLGKVLGRHIIAEGVENVEQGRRLIELGCEFAQGYIIAEPMPADQFLSWSKTWQPDLSWRSIERDKKIHVENCHYDEVIG